MVPAVSDRIPGGVTRSARPSQTVPVPRCRFRVGSYYPGRASTPPVWAPSVSIATTPDIDISFSSCRYLDVSVPCVRSGYKPVTGRLPAGFPHSDTPGSLPVLGSPGFFAVVRVLRRLLKPRHPPCALIAFCSVLAGPKTGRALKLLNFRPLLLLPRYLFPSIVNELKWAAKIQTFSLLPNLFAKFFRNFSLTASDTPANQVVDKTIIFPDWQ